MTQLGSTSERPNASSEGRSCSKTTVYFFRLAYNCSSQGMGFRVVGSGDRHRSG